MPAQWMKTYINNGDARLKGSLLLRLLALAHLEDEEGWGKRTDEALIAKRTRLNVDQVRINLQKLEILRYLVTFRYPDDRLKYYMLYQPDIPKDVSTDREEQQI